MAEIINIFLIGIALSMDTFSLSLGIGTYNLKRQKCLILSTIVGIMHFIMPFLGNILGQNLMNFFSMNSNLFLGCILLFIAANLLIDLIKNEPLEEINFSLFVMFLFAFGISIYAFSAITQNKILAMSIFSLTSFFFTATGLFLGKFASQKLGKKANILGLGLLIVLGIFHICK